MRLAPKLRQALCDTAQELGPQPPTLCPPWGVRELLAHLVVRDSRPDAAAGVLGGPLAAHTARVHRAIADRPFEDLVQRVRQGPPRWSPIRLAPVAERVDTVELAVHHEDLRRAQPGWEPQLLHHDVQQRLWRSLRAPARLRYRRAPVGVVLVAPGHGRAAVRGPGAAPTGTVVLTGAPLELLLHTLGRTAVAQVRPDGAPADLAALQHWQRAA